MKFRGFYEKCSVVFYWIPTFLSYFYLFTEHVYKSAIKANKFSYQWKNRIKTCK